MKTANQPAGEKIAGDGTWGEGRPAFAEIGVPAPSTDKRGSQAPSIQIKGEAGEIPSSPVSMPGKGGGDAGAQGAAALGKAEAEARGSAPEAGGGQGDPCARSSTKMPDGTQPGISRKESTERPTVHERVCGKGQVHSSLRGRPAKEMVGGAAPDGTFAEQKLGAPTAQPQGPAGAASRGVEKSMGFGTAHIATGSCAPESPAMTVKMPPRHPALAATPPRPRPQPVPSYGNRASLPVSARADGQTLAPRGLSVSQVHLSGPLSRAGPRVPRRDALGAAPDSAVAPDSAPSTALQAVSPDGAFGGGKAGPGGGAAIPFTPTAQQAAGGGGGGGGGGLTPAQQHATNAIRMDENKGELHTRESLLPHYEKQAKDAQAKLEPLEKKRQEHFQAQAAVDAAKQRRDEAQKQVNQEIKDGKFVEGGASEQALNAANRDLDKAKENAKGKEFSGEVAAQYNEAKKDADEKQKKLDDKNGEKADLEREQQTLNAKNRKLEDGMTPTERARAEKEKERLKRDQDRQREIQQRLDEKRKRREERNANRPDYRATQRAKAKRADNKRSKSLAKAKKFAKAAKNPNMSKTAKKKAVEKAKKALQKAKEAGRAKIEAMEKSGASKKEIDDEKKKQAEENAEVEQEIEEAEAGIDNGVAPEPQPDPCSLPCECPDCDDGICICFRWPEGGGDDGGEGGGDDGGDDGGGGGGGAGGAEPPDIKIPEGSSVAEPENGDDDGKRNEKGEKSSGNGKDRGPGPFMPPGGAAQFPEGAYCCAPQGNGAPPQPPPPPPPPPKGWEDKVRQYAATFFKPPPAKTKPDDPEPVDDCKDKALVIIDAVKWAKAKDGARYERNQNFDGAVKTGAGVSLGDAVDEATLLGILAKESSFGDPAAFQPANIGKADYGPFQILPKLVEGYNKANGTKVAHKDVGDLGVASKIAAWHLAHEVQKLTETKSEYVVVKDGREVDKVPVTQKAVSNKNDAAKMTLAAYNAGGNTVLGARERARDAAVEKAQSEKAKAGKGALTPEEVKAIRLAAGNTYAEIEAYLPHTTQQYVREVQLYAQLVRDCLERARKSQARK